MAEVGPFALTSLADLVRRLFEAAGLAPDEAALIAGHVVDAEARGNRSQGLVRVPAYLRWARAGEIAPGAPLTVERDQGAVLVLDAHNGWGHPAAARAMDLCVERAAQTGVCLAVVRQANHMGRLGYYVERAAAQGMIGLIACSGNPSSGSVAPWGGTQALFGTNPVAFGFPRRAGPPVVVDVSTTQAARGTVLLMQKTGRPLPDGWAFDRRGEPTRDPGQALPPHGTLAPLGGHKGYALAVALEILCGVLQGLWPPRTAADFVGAMRVEAFLRVETYEESLEAFIAAVKRSPRRAGVEEILLPGEGSARRARGSAARGVMVSAPLWQEIREAARDLRVEDPLL